MSHYIATIANFRFEREGDTLVVTSYGDDFREEFDYPEDIDPRDDGVESELHERFYARVVEAYYDHKL